MTVSPLRPFLHVASQAVAQSLVGLRQGVLWGIVGVIDNGDDTPRIVVPHRRSEQWVLVALETVEHDGTCSLWQCPRWRGGPSP